MLEWSELVSWGVIDAARRRQRRHRLAAGAILTVALAAALTVFVPAGVEHPRLPRLRLASSLTWLTGPRLGPTGLRLVVSENYGGPVSLVNVDSGQVKPLGQLDAPSPPGSSISSNSVSLTQWHQSALAVVIRQACAHCAITEDDFVVSPAGAVHRLATRHFPAFDGTIERTQVPGSLAEWVLRRPHHGPCTLSLVPSARSAVRVPCGDLGQVYGQSVVLWTQQDPAGVLIDPLTGAVRRHLNPTRQVASVGHGYSIEGSSQGIGSLKLINQATRQSRSIRWPSRLHFGYRLFPDPVAPLVAIEFADPAYPDYTNPRPTTTLGQAADLWLLNIQSGKLTHVPGFPIFELLKFSGVAWTTDGRLVIAADGGSFAQPARRAAIGVWRPGEPTVPVGALPLLHGYDQIVPLAGPNGRLSRANRSAPSAGVPSH